METSRPYVGQTPNDQLPPTTTQPIHSLPLLPQSSTTRKRRASASGSRGVANLSPEQLAKKRANDREAQRAIRERTKGQIENLERKIQELTAQKPYQELQHAIRQKELVETENEEIKRRLISIQSLIQPLLNPTCTNGPTPHLNNDSPGSTTYTTGESRASTLAAPTYSDVASVRSSASTTSTHISPQVPRPTPPIPQTTFPPQLSHFSTVDAFGQHPGIAPNNINNRPQDDKLALNFLMQNRHNGGDGLQNVSRERAISASSNAILPMDTLTPSQSLNGGKILAPYAVPIRNVPPTCPLDCLLLDFLADRRKQAIDGIPISELIGPIYPSFLSLVNPQRKQFSHPLSKVFTDMMATFPDISALPEQVAILYVMFLVMRWQIAPTQENCDRLPEWMTPRPPQLFVPHPAWLDYLPWPRMRDKLVRLYPSFPFDEFFIPYTTTVSLNWPYDPQAVLVATPGSEELSINPSFENHLRDLSNWSLGPAFAKAHPVLADTTTIKVDVDLRRSS